MPNDHNLTFAPAAFQGALLSWYDRQRRDLPWRARSGEKSDPYRVWLSEVMLQQTTVKAVIPYYEKFLSRWPTAEALGAAPRDDVLAAWAGLGYYSRARNLHACAQVIAREGFPASAETLRTLPGIGVYTAAAIASIAFDEPAVVVDGNVERVVARVFAVEMPLPAAKPAIFELAAVLTPASRPGDYAQAMMDLGATVCTPKSPSCLMCPVRKFCGAARAGSPETFPRKKRKEAKPVRRGDAYIVISYHRRGPLILLRRRQDKGLLGGMMEVPCSDWVANGEAEPEGRPHRLFAMEGAWRSGQAVRHTFTHFHLEMAIYATDRLGEEEARNALGGDFAPVSEIEEMALPAVMKKAATSGLHALGLLTGSGKAASKASKVSTVDRSARPSTRAGRK